MNYKEAVEFLADTKSKEVIMNRGNERCIITLTQLALSSKNQIRLYAGSLNPEICDDSGYVKAIRSFLDNGGELKIMTENVPNPDSLLYEMIKNYPLDSPGKVSLKSSIPKWLKYNKFPIHFATGDDAIYRIETDPEARYARVCFNNEKATSILNNHFDKKFEKSA